ELAREARPTGQARHAHVGYYLIDAGRATLEAELGYHPTPIQAVQRAILKHPTAFYLGSLAVATTAAVAAGLRLVHGPEGTKQKAKGKTPIGALLPVAF